MEPDRDPRPPRWHAAISRGISCLVVGMVLVAGSLAATGALLVTLPDFAADFERRPERVVKPVIAAAGLVSVVACLILSAGCILLSRGMGNDRRPQWLFAPIFGILFLGLAGLADFDPRLRIGHAPFALLGVASILFGIPFVGRGLGPVADDLGITPDPDRRRLLAITFVSLAAGILVSFLPLALEHATPRSCAIRVAGIAASALSVPAFATVGPLRRFGRQVSAARDGARWCPACGYPRPAGTRCPECGLDPATLAP